jgi:two-component system cell cycle response regulator DivK
VLLLVLEILYLYYVTAVDFFQSQKAKQQLGPKRFKFMDFGTWLPYGMRSAPSLDMTKEDCTIDRRPFQNEMPKRVLLVEDNKDLLNILASILRSSGYDTVEAKSGGEAIEKAASAQPGLILLDLDLPDMKGLDAARSIRRNKRSAHIPVIACSAFGREEREEALRSGMVDYLQKPFSARILKAKVEEFILRQ